MTKLLLPHELTTAPAPSDAYIKSKIISRYKKAPVDLSSRLGDLIKKLCTASRLNGLIKFVIYQPNFYFEIIAPDEISKTYELEFSVDTVKSKAGSIRVPVRHQSSLLLSLDKLEHELWHATQFFLHHPPSSQCDTPMGAPNTYPFLPLTSHSLNQDWQMLSAVLQTIRKIRQQLEPFLEGPLPANVDSLPEPSRRLVNGIQSLPKSSPYKMLFSPLKGCSPTVEMQLRQSATKQLIGPSIHAALKVRTVLESAGNFGPMQCVTYTHCSQINHPICQSLDWTAFALGRIYSYELTANLKLSLSLTENLAQHPAVFWNALVKRFPQSQLTRSFNTTAAFQAVMAEFPVPATPNTLIVPAQDRYKLSLQAAKIPPEELGQQLNLLVTQIEQVIRFAIEADTIFMTELGDPIYHIESYHQISEQHQQNLNKWLGFCSNGTAMAHVPHPEECLNQPARCGELTFSPADSVNHPLSIHFQSAFNSLLLSFTLQSLQHKISPNTFKKISSMFEFCALIVCAGPVLGTLSFTIGEGVKFANRRYRWCAESKAETAIRALPIAGLFVTASSDLAQTGLTVVTNFAGSMVGAKLADWAFGKSK